MHELREAVVGLILIGALLLIVFSFIYLWRLNTLFRLLRRFAPSEWERLGSPSIFKPTFPLPREHRVLRWFFRREFEAIDSHEIVAQARACRSLLIFGLTLTAVELPAFILVGLWKL